MSEAQLLLAAGRAADEHRRPFSGTVMLVTAPQGAF